MNFGSVGGSSGGFDLGSLVSGLSPISPFVSLANGFLSFLGQRQTNKTNLKIAREANALQEQLNTVNNSFAASQAELAWKRYTDWNDPSAQVQRFTEAGINPALAMSGGGQMSASAPQAQPHGSGISPIAAQMQNPLVNPFGSFAADLEKAASVKEKLSHSNLQDTQARQMDSTLDSYIRSMNADARYKEVSASVAEMTALQYAQGKNALIAAQAIESAKKAYLMQQQGDTEASKRSLNESVSELNRVLASLHGEEKKLLQKQIDTFEETHRANLRLVESQTTANYSDATLNHALTDESNTRTALNNSQLSYALQVGDDLVAMTKNARNMSDHDMDAYADKLAMQLDMMLSESIILEKDRAEAKLIMERLEKWHTHPFYQGVDEFLNMCDRVSGIVGNVTGAYKDVQFGRNADAFAAPASETHTETVTRYNSRGKLKDKTNRVYNTRRSR